MKNSVWIHADNGIYHISISGISKIKKKDDLFFSFSYFYSIEIWNKNCSYHRLLFTKKSKYETALKQLGIV